MNNNKEYKNGERLSFYQIFTKKDFHIEVPIIQRDYAQGRPSFDENRPLFLKALHTYLKEDKPYRDLDFIYGTIEVLDKQNLFIPLDGQQRLTTLFLLHWYLALKEGKIKEFNKVLQHDGKSKFRYKIRTSSTDFFNALLKEGENINLKDIQNTYDARSYNDIKEIILDSNWFYSNWKNDPTVKSVLKMMNAIHEEFKNSEPYFDKLIDNEKPIITFMFLDLGKYNLTDDLYIKMNARGKELTPFENFKAKLEQHIKKLFKDSDIAYEKNYGDNKRKMPVPEYFSHQIDTDWTNLFWEYKNEKGEIDNKIMNFIQTLFVNHLAKYDNSSSVKKSDLKLGSIVDKKKISFNDFHETGYLNKEFIIELIDLLDILRNINKDKFLPNDFFYYDEHKILKNSLDYVFPNIFTRIQFHAYCQYLIKHKTSKGLDEWMRLIHNLTANAPYDGFHELVRDIKAIQKLLEYSSSIITHLSKEENILEEGFVETQRKEEKIKAFLLQKKEWRDRIIKAEQHKYFTGQIGFLLNFSGVEEYYNKHNNCNWSDDENKVFISSFDNYHIKSLTIFNENGLKNFKDHTWQRALLCKGNYLLREGSNLSFLIDRDRDISWKRLLFADGGVRLNKRKLVKELFDGKGFNLNTPEEYLQEIISTEGKTNDWREGFIQYPELISYLGSKKYIRMDEYNTLLLKKEKTSAEYSEYYSRWFYNKIIDRSFSPFKKPDYLSKKGREHVITCTVLDNYKRGNNCYAIDISFENKMYNIKLFNRTKNENGISIIEESISDCVGSLGYVFEEEVNQNSVSKLITRVSNQDEAIKCIDTICNALNNLNDNS